MLVRRHTFTIEIEHKTLRIQQTGESPACIAALSHNTSAPAVPIPEKTLKTSDSDLELPGTPALSNPVLQKEPCHEQM